MRDHIDPKKDLGHSDRHGKKKPSDEPKVAGDEAKPLSNEPKTNEAPADNIKRNPDDTICEDCR